MNTEQFKQLAERAKNDPTFFHNLVYNPQQAIEAFQGLDRETQARLLSLDPEEVVERLVVAIVKCGVTCGDDSCERTCGTRSCGVTCASSCSGSTCGGKSCGQTTFFAEPFFE
jgi:hypothetical protein